MADISFRQRLVKADTLELAPERWFSVRDYLEYTANQIAPEFAGEGRVLELVEERLPSEKALSMRLLRYSRQGLLERRRHRHRFLYRVTEKGRLRGLLLQRRAEPTCEYLPDLSRKKAKLTRSRPASGLRRVDIFGDPSRLGHARAGPASQGGRQCLRCGQILLSPRQIVCPRCHRLT